MAGVAFTVWAMQLCHTRRAACHLRGRQGTCSTSLDGVDRLGCSDVAAFSKWEGAFAWLAPRLAGWPWLLVF